MSNENPVIRRPIRITRAHHTDLVCAAMNDTTGASQKILDRMTEDPGFQIDEQPVEGVFYIDQSIRFMYPHEIGFVEAVLPPNVVYPDDLPPPQFDLSHGVVPGHHFIDELALRDHSLRDLNHLPPILSFDVERADGSKVADYLRKIKLSDIKPTIVVDSFPPELYEGHALQLHPCPEPSEDGTLIDPDRKPKPPPSGLLMRLMSRL